MPQINPFYPAKTPSNVAAPLNIDAQGALLMGEGKLSALNISAATVVKATPGRLVRIIVNTPGSTAGTASDCATTAAVTAANLIANIPATAGLVMSIVWPCSTGIVITPGTGQVLSVSYS